jgi:2-phospho-L-lactate guanylyltransferase (CobY/MobA/RfbA family)
MLGLVLSAIRDSRSFDRTAVVGDIPKQDGTIAVADHGSFAENLFAGLRAADGAELAVVATCDLPFLTGEVLAEFANDARSSGADLVYAAVPVEACYDRFPGIERTSVRLREGRLTGGNVVAARPGVLLGQENRIRAAYAARKSPFRLAWMFGLGTTLRAAIALTIAPRLLGLGELERAASRVLGCSVKALLSDRPEIATDIDRPKDLEAMRSLLG